MAQIRMEIGSLRHAMHDDEWVVLLKEKSRQRYLPICVGSEQAESLTRALTGKPLDESAGDFCSLPHIISILPMVESASVTIGRLDGNEFFAKLSLSYRGRNHEIELPAAKALILGVRAGAHIFAEESVLDRALVATPV